MRFEHDWYEPVERSVVIVSAPKENAQFITFDFAKAKAKLKPGKTVPP